MVSYDYRRGSTFDFRQALFLSQLLCVYSLILGIFLSPSQSFASYPSYLLVLIAAISPGFFFRVFGVSSFIFFGLVLAYFLLSTTWSEGLDWRSFGSSLVRVVLVLAFVLGLVKMYSKKPNTSFSAQLRYLDWLFYSSDFNCLACRSYDDRLEFRNPDAWPKLSREPCSLGNTLRLGHALFVRSMVNRKTWRNRVPLSLILVILALAVFLCGSVNSQISLFVAVSALLIKRKAFSVISVFFSILVVFLVLAIWSQFKSLDELVGFFLPRGTVTG